MITCDRCNEELASCECGEDREVVTFDHPENGPSCPHCGYIKIIQDWECYNLYDEGEHKESCPDCNKNYIVYTNVSYIFNSRRAKDGE